MSRRITGLELFSGAGGLACGLSQAGVTHEGFFEWNKDACETLRQNYEPSLVHDVDIREMDFSDYEGVDIKIGRAHV